MIAPLKVILTIILIVGAGLPAVAAVLSWPDPEAFILLGTAVAIFISVGLALVVIAIYDKLDDIATLAAERNRLLKSQLDSR